MIIKEEFIDKLVDIMNQYNLKENTDSTFMLVMSKDNGDLLGDTLANRNDTHIKDLNFTNACIKDERFKDGRLHVLISHQYVEGQIALVPMDSPRPLRITVTIE